MPINGIVTSTRKIHEPSTAKIQNKMYKNIATLETIEDTLNILLVPLPVCWESVPTHAVIVQSCD
jgi:hypothetical protein